MVRQQTKIPDKVTNPADPIPYPGLNDSTYFTSLLYTKGQANPRSFSPHLLLVTIIAMLFLYGQATISAILHRATVTMSNTLFITNVFPVTTK